MQSVVLRCLHVGAGSFETLVLADTVASLVAAPVFMYATHAARFCDWRLVLTVFVFQVRWPCAPALLCPQCFAHCRGAALQAGSLQAFCWPSEHLGVCTEVACRLTAIPHCCSSLLFLWT